ncbi:MAG: hypothetical protein ACRDP6_10670 [Actinoallomurus sp.]
MRRRSLGASAALHTTLVAATAAAVFPVLWLVLTSIKPRDGWQSTNVRIFDHPTLANYDDVLTRTSFLRWMANSVLVAGATTVICVAIAASTGYAISRFRFPGLAIAYLTVAIPFSAWMMTQRFADGDGELRTGGRARIRTSGPGACSTIKRSGWCRGSRPVR